MSSNTSHKFVVITKYRRLQTMHTVIHKIGYFEEMNVVNIEKIILFIQWFKKGLSKARNFIFLRISPQPSPYLQP